MARHKGAHGTTHHPAHSRLRKQHGVKKENKHMSHVLKHSLVHKYEGSHAAHKPVHTHHSSAHSHTAAHHTHPTGHGGSKHKKA